VRTIHHKKCPGGLECTPVLRLSGIGVLSATISDIQCEIHDRSVHLLVRAAPRTFHGLLSYNRIKYEAAQTANEVFVSRAWNFLKEGEPHVSVGARDDASHEEAAGNFERRRGSRLWVYLPVLVYGRTIESDPFHEGTEALRVNAGGGLITLTTPVRCGQRLLLINKVNQKEHECHVVAERSKYLQRTAVVIGFREPAPDFWR
jgi:hypothetical protein